MHRILFEKTDDAIWISHLDVMRIFQRAFLREHIPIAHTQGFSPHAFVSVLLPLSVGTQSHCELLECKLEDNTIGFEEIAARLNRTLPAGIRVLQVYESGRKAKELVFLKAQVWLEYDAGVAPDAAEKLNALFQSPTLTVEKRSKKGTSQVDIIPMLKKLEVRQEGEDCLVLDCVVCAQNPSLNPMLLAAAIETYLPELGPDFAWCCRLEVLDAAGETFR